MDWPSPSTAMEATLTTPDFFEIARKNINFSTILSAWDENHDGKVTCEELTHMLDHSKDAQSGVMRSIIEVFFTILGGSAGVVDVQSDAPRAPEAAQKAFKQVTGQSLPTRG